MKIQYSIVSSDNNPMYLEFWPIVKNLWSEFIGIKPILVLISDKDLITDYGDHIIHEIKSAEGYSSSFQSQIVRMFVTKFYEKEVCITSDIDMLPLSKSYFNNTLSEIEEDSLAILSSDAYNTIRYPICYNVGKGSTFNKILGLNCEFSDYCKKLSEFNQGWDTDELYFGKSVNEYPERNKITFMKRGWINGRALNRIDRSEWRYDIEKLKNGDYIDCHSLRPFSSYKNQIKKLIDHLK